MKLFQHGKTMENGKKLYAKGLYAEAKIQFAQALTYNPKDFNAHFWYARASVLLGETETALTHLTICSAMKPKLADLINPWFECVTRQGGAKNEDSDEIRQLNHNTDQYLTRCYQRIEHNLLNTLKLFGFFLLANAFMYLIRALQGDVWGVMSAFLITFVVCRTIADQTILPLDYYGRFKLLISELNRLMKAPSFVLGMVVFLVFVYGLVHFGRADWEWEKYKQLSTYKRMGEVSVFHIMVSSCQTILSELAFLYGLYNYFLKYDKKLAYISVALITSWTNLSWFKVNSVMYALISTFFYDKHQTLLAPIIVDVMDRAVGYLLIWLLVM